MARPKPEVAPVTKAMLLERGEVMGSDCSRVRDRSPS